MALAVRHGAAAAGARRAEGKCVRFTERCGIGLFKDTAGTEYNCFARVARDGLAKDGKHKLGSIFEDKNKMYGWEWEPSADPAHTRSNITSIWNTEGRVWEGAELGLPCLDPNFGKEGRPPLGMEGAGYRGERVRRHVRRVAMKGEKNANIGFNVYENCIVTDIVKDGPADKAGLQNGWVVRSINGIEVSNRTEFGSALRLQVADAIVFGFDTSAVVNTTARQEKKRQKEQEEKAQAREQRQREEQREERRRRKEEERRQKEDRRQRRDPVIVEHWVMPQRPARDAERARSRDRDK
eukprot:gene6424-4002_t